MIAAPAVQSAFAMPQSDAGPRRSSDERALVVAAQKGSSDAFAALVRLHQRRAYAVCRAIVVTHEDAEELSESAPAPFRDPGEADELRRRLTEALTRLTDRQRSVIVLHDVEGFTHGEIGSMLGIPEGTARSDLHHARAALRRLLKDVRSDL